MPSTETLLKYHQHQGHTYDCAPYTVATVINAVRDQALVEGAAVAREMNRPRLRWWGPLPLPVVRRIPNSATFPWGIADELGRNNIPCRWRFGAMEADLHQALLEDRIALPIVGGWIPLWAHVKILAAFHPNHGFGFVDAAHPKAEIVWQNESAFKRSWRNFGNLLVETM